MRTKIGAGVAAGALALAFTGAAALAAFEPATVTALVAGTDTGAAPAAHAERGGDALRAVLERLVANGTITQEQADKIVAAVTSAAEEAREKAKERLEERKQKAKEHDRAEQLLKRVLGAMLRHSVQYIGLPHEAVAAQMKAGKSLGEIAATQPGKTREGLIRHLVEQLSAAIDEAAAEGKITPERAAEWKAKLPEQVTRFVDHKYERKHEQPRRERQDKKPAPSATPRPTT